VSVRTYVSNAGRGQLSSEWRHNENDVIMIIAGLVADGRRYGDWRHVDTGCNALVFIYIGHGRPCVCLSLAAFLHYCTDPDVTSGNGTGCPLVVRYCADLQLVHGFRCYYNIAPSAKCQRVLYSLYARFIFILIFISIFIFRFLFIQVLWILIHIYIYISLLQMQVHIYVH